MEERTDAAARVFKRLRFGLRTLLCVPVLVGVVWWWTSWPYRTAQRFVERLNKGDVAGARAMVAPQGVSPVAAANDIWDLASQGDTTFLGSVLKPRAFADLIRAKGEFSISEDNPSNNRHIHFGGFGVVRGRVQPHYAQHSSMLLTAYRLQSKPKDVFDQLLKSPPNAAMQIAEAPDGALIVRSSKEGHEELRKLIKGVDQPSQP